MAESIKQDFGKMGFVQSIADNWGKIILAVLTGGLLTAGFPEMGVAYAAWGALVFLLFAIRDAGPRKSFMLGLLAGMVHYLSLIYWLVPTMRIYGYLPVSLSLLLLILLALYLAIYPAVFAFLLTWTGRRPAVILIMAPVFWVSLEYLRSILFSGFPWGLLGYSQADYLGLIQFADIFGVYGISAIIVVANAALLVLVLGVSKKPWQGVRIRGWLAGAGCLAVLAALGAIFGYSQFRMHAMDRLSAEAETLDVGVIQGNIRQLHKWDRRFRETTIQKYFDLSQAPDNPTPELIIWPETAAPFYFDYHTELTEQVLSGIQQADKYFIIGAPSVELDHRAPKYYNSAYLIGPAGQVLDRYNKVHLVPFGEYVPFNEWLPFIDTMVAQVGSFDAGQRGHTMGWDDVKIGMLICYESIFPALSIEMVNNGADFLINITNDAWFGKTSAPYQHFSMAVFRAIENRRTLVRAANTGISGYIDPVGRVMETSHLFETAVLSRGIPLIKDHETFYTRHKDWLPIGCLIASGMIIVVQLFFKKSRHRWVLGRGNRRTPNT
ncbi:MAG TPA: apolipoprotein N-acyltransferase [Desulfosalsimonadaceae bacterium]|nr:apolipoprotein N-acyltransferase [Desulfosalsimonadaceae bacterium]